MAFPTDKETLPQRDTGQTILKEFFNVYSDFLDALQDTLGYGDDYMLVNKLKAGASDFIYFDDKDDNFVMGIDTALKVVILHTFNKAGILNIGHKAVDFPAIILRNSDGNPVTQFVEGSAKVMNLKMHDDTNDQTVQMGSPYVDGWIKCVKFGINTETPTDELEVNGNINATGYKVGGTTGASGSFTTVDAKTVTVVNGIITAIV